MKKRILWSVLVIMAVILAAFLSRPYFQVERLTKKYGLEFEERYKDNGYCESIDYLKVFKYHDESVDISYLDNRKLKNRLNNLGEDYALVLYIEDNHSFAELYVFHDEGDRWVLSEWNTIWSYSGSADSFMWPYYP